MPLGSNETKKVNVRIIAATNRNLKELIKDKFVREDFFYRIHIIPIYLPPLRDRIEDIPLLIEHFMKMYGGPYTPLAGKILDQFLNYNWPGNVRELQNVIHRYISMKKLDFTGLPKVKTKLQQEQIQNPEESDMQGKMGSYEKEIIESTLKRYQWHRTQVAKALGINRKTLFIKMAKYGLQKPQNGAK